MPIETHRRVKRDHGPKLVPTEGQVGHCAVGAVVAVSPEGNVGQVRVGLDDMVDVVIELGSRVHRVGAS